MGPFRFAEASEVRELAKSSTTARSAVKRHRHTVAHGRDAEILKLYDVSIT